MEPCLVLMESQNFCPQVLTVLHIDLSSSLRFRGAAGLTAAWWQVCIERSVRSILPEREAGKVGAAMLHQILISVLLSQWIQPQQTNRASFDYESNHNGGERGLQNGIKWLSIWWSTGVWRVTFLTATWFRISKLCNWWLIRNGASICISSKGSCKTAPDLMIECTINMRLICYSI